MRTAAIQLIVGVCNEKLTKIRGIQFLRQGGRCYYCRHPMWSNGLEAFAQKYQISIRQARHFKATAEHLLPRSKGGRDREANIAAACQYCNSRRHRSRFTLTPDAYRKKVINRVARGRWHCVRFAFA
ncbi:MAG: HNH endonuclease [Sphingomonadales bacterium]|nr:HNH endonuclease [Sphingomonadales bacterium]